MFASPGPNNYAVWFCVDVEHHVYGIIQPHRSGGPYSRADEQADYHWRELPQVACLSRHTRICRDKIRVCRDKIRLLSRQSFFRAIFFFFFATNIILSRQADFCRDKHVFVATRRVFCRDKTFLATNTPLSRQILSLHHFRRDKNDTCGRSCQRQ